MEREDENISVWESKKYLPKLGEPELPPQLSEFTEKSADDIIKELNRLPFFMNQLDDTDGDGGENVHLEALKSLAYEGEPDEIATNFKNQGNECFKLKNFKDAVQYYTQGLDANCGVDSINVALYINRAACNLELKNFRRCIEDCKKALMVDESNVKACYRAGRAFFAVERYSEAEQILEFGLSKDSENAPIKQTLIQVREKVQQIEDQKKRIENAKRQKSLEKDLLTNALGIRNVEIIKSSRPNDLLDGVTLRLEDPKDYESQLIIPTMIIYPTTDEFDFVAEVSELSTPNDILAMVLDRPQSYFDDPKHKNFTMKSLEFYMETISGGLIKIGKKAPFNAALMADTPKAPLFDNALRLYVLPKQDSAEWVSKWKREDAIAKRKI